MRKKDIYFFERQRFSQWWLWVLLVGVNLLFIAGIIQQIGFGKPFGNNPMSDVGLMITTAVLFLFTVAFLSGSLRTFINKEGVYVRFTPFVFRYRLYPWEDIQAVFIRGYNPLGEFGGWGIRRGIGGIKAYTVSGKVGLELFLKNGKKILIGTNQPVNLKSILVQLGKMEQESDG